MLVERLGDGVDDGDEDDAAKAIVGGKLERVTSVERLGWVHATIFHQQAGTPRPLQPHWSGLWRAICGWLRTGCQPDGGRMAAGWGQRGLTTQGGQAATQ